MRLAICGAGSAAMRAHLPALARTGGAPAPLIVGVTDCDPARLRQARTRLPSARPFDSVERMLDETAPSLLVVATPPSAHRHAIAAAVDRGVHVLCEKPVGLTGEDVAALARLRAAHPDVLLATVLQYRHAPTWRLFAQAVEAALGRGEPFRLRVLVERPGTDPLSIGGWRADPAREGGILGDHAVHYLALCWGLDPAVHVVECRRSGGGGSESATVVLALGNGDAEIHVTYAGRSRRNVITLERPAEGLRLHWEDDGLLIAGAPSGPAPEPVEALSDRSLVNDLYVSLYDELLTHLGDGSWRALRSTETVGVAALLAAALGTGGGGPASTPPPGRVP